MTPAHVTAAARAYASRRARDLLFGADRDGFGEPGWDMLLSIVASGTGGSVSDEDLIKASATPEDIARPYLAWLASRDLVKCSHGDVTLTDRGHALMAAFLEHPGV